MDEETTFGYQEGGGYHGDVAGGKSVVTETPEEMVRVAAIGDRRVQQTREWGSKPGLLQRRRSPNGSHSQIRLWAGIHAYRSQGLPKKSAKRLKLGIQSALYGVIL